MYSPLLLNTECPAISDTEKLITDKVHSRTKCASVCVLSQRYVEVTMMIPLDAQISYRYLFYQIVVEYMDNVVRMDIIAWCYYLYWLPVYSLK